MRYFKFKPVYWTFDVEPMVFIVLLSLQSVPILATSVA